MYSQNFSIFIATRFKYLHFKKKEMKYPEKDGLIFLTPGDIISFFKDCAHAVQNIDKSEIWSPSYRRFGGLR